jgi:hypothetical protein
METATKIIPDMAGLIALLFLRILNFIVGVNE